MMIQVSPTPEPRSRLLEENPEGLALTEARTAALSQAMSGNWKSRSVIFKPEVVYIGCCTAVVVWICLNHEAVEAVTNY
jgi:hypothetical protein